MPRRKGYDRRITGVLGVAPIVIANFVALRVDSPASKSTPSRERVARMPPL